MGENTKKKAPKLLKSKKTKFFAILLACLIILFIIHGIFFYTPPLLDSGKRDVFENTIDFFSFAWHLTKASVTKDFLGDSGKANEYFAKAGWYRKEYLLNRFFVEEKDLDRFLEKNRNQDIKTIRKDLYVFLMTPKKRE